MSKTQYTYRHPHPAVAVDIVVWSVSEDKLQLLLVKRGVDPFKGKWALPGGFLRMAENLEAAASRELAEETGVKNVPLSQIGAFGSPDRDPRERVVSIAHAALVRRDVVQLGAGTDAADASWFDTNSLPPLAFDHSHIVAKARAQLIESTRHTGEVFNLLPPEFTLTELQRVFEAIYGHPLDKRNFRKWIEQMELVRPTKKYSSGGRHRPALLYRRQR